MPYFWSGLGQAVPSSIVSAAATAASAVASAVTGNNVIQNSWQSQVLVLAPLLGINWPQVVSQSQTILNNAQNLGAFTLLPFLSILTNLSLSQNPSSDLVNSAQNAYKGLLAAAHLEDLATDLDRIQNENAISKQMDDILAKAAALTNGWMGLYTSIRPAKLNALKTQWQTILVSVNTVPLTFEGYQRLWNRANDIQGAVTLSWETILWGSVGVAVVYPTLRWILEKGKIHARKRIKKHFKKRKFKSASDED